MFQKKNFKGQSVVLSAGDYYNTAVLPFGNNQLSSVHRTGTLDENMANIRRQISNARGIGTCVTLYHMNSVYSVFIGRLLHLLVITYS